MKLSLLFFVILSIWLILNNCLCLEQGGKHVCRDNNTGALYCCFNYELNNNQCVECKEGFSAEAGQPCMPCKKQHYGYRCLHRCKCESFQLCDPLSGCVEMIDSTVSVSSSRRGNFMTGTTLKNTTQITTDQNQEPPQRNDEEGHMTLFVYIFVVSAIILLLGGFHKYRMYRKSKCDTDCTTLPEAATNSDIQFQEPLYDEIVDTMIN